MPDVYVDALTTDISFQLNRPPFIACKLDSLNQQPTDPTTAIFSDLPYNPHNGLWTDNFQLHYERLFPPATVTSSILHELNPVTHESIVMAEYQTPVTLSPEDVICVSKTISDTGDYVCFTGLQSTHDSYESRLYPGGNGLVSYQGRRWHGYYSGAVMDARVKDEVIYIVSTTVPLSGKLALEYASADGGGLTLILDCSLTSLGVTANSVYFPFADQGSGQASCLCAKLHPDCTELSVIYSKVASPKGFTYLELVYPITFDEFGVLSVGVPSVTYYPVTWLRSEISGAINVSSIGTTVTPAPGFYGTVSTYGGSFQYDEASYSSLSSQSYAVSGTAGPVYNGRQDIDVVVVDGVTTTTTVTWTAKAPNAPVFLTDSSTSSDSIIYGFDRHTNVHVVIDPPPPEGQPEDTDTDTQDYFATTAVRIVLTENRQNATYTRTTAITGNGLIAGLHYISDPADINYGTRQTLTYEVRTSAAGKAIEYESTAELYDFSLSGTLDLSHPKCQEQLQWARDAVAPGVSRVIKKVKKVGDLRPAFYLGSSLVGRHSFGYRYGTLNDWTETDERTREINSLGIVTVVSIKGYRETPDASISQPAMVSRDGYWVEIEGSTYIEDEFSCYNSTNIHHKYTQAQVAITPSEAGAGLTEKIGTSFTTQGIMEVYTVVNGVEQRKFYNPGPVSSPSSPELVNQGGSLYGLDGYYTAGSALQTVTVETPTSEEMDPYYTWSTQGFRHQMAEGVYLVAVQSSKIFNSTVPENFLWLEDASGNILLNITQILTPSGWLTIDNAAFPFGGNRILCGYAT